MSLDTSADPVKPVHECGTCNICCKVQMVPEFDKPVHTWCPNCDIGKGCKIYESRPERCRGFYCLYTLNEQLGPEWRPDRCHIMLVSEYDGLRVVAFVDPKRPDAWKKPPFYGSFKKWAREGAAKGFQMMIDIANRTIMILPDHDVDLGVMGEDDRLLPMVLPGGRQTYTKVHKDDPRLRLQARR